MLFSGPIIGQALFWTVAAVVAIAAIRFALTRTILPGGYILGSTALAFVVNLFYTYEFLPAHTGATYGNWLYVAILSAIVIAFQFFGASNAGDARSSKGNVGVLLPVVLVVCAVIFLLGFPIGQRLIHQWPMGNSTQWADQANITIAPAEANLPQTDNRHIPLVDRDTAAFLAQGKLGADNIGSKYGLDKSDFVKQSINGHLWWVCPLEYKSGWTQFWDALSGNQDFPGFVLVDAEDPDQNKVELVHNLHLKYTNGAFFSKNIQRYVYSRGYTDGNLTDPTIELDDNREPYITIAYTRPKFVVGGEEVVSVLLVNMKTGDIQEKPLNDVPLWVDRVISEDMAMKYAENWGAFHFPGTGWLTSSFNGGSGQMKPDHAYMAYNTADIPVYHIPMTAKNGSNHSATGVLVYETRTQSGVFYPGLSGMNLDNSTTLKNIPANNNGNGQMAPTEIGLYNVDGQTTWVAIYTTPQKIGRAFAGIGMMDAHNPSPTSVAFGENKITALRKYETYLAVKDPNGATIHSGQTAHSIKGVVVKVNWVVDKVYVVLDTDPQHRYAASLNVIGGADLVELTVGETVTFEYYDAGARQVEVTGVQYDPTQKK